MLKRLPLYDLGIAVLLAVLCAVFFWRILVPSPADRGSFPGGDFANQFYAFSVFEAQEWHAGRVPLWCPYANSGFPFEADIQSAVFYPPSLLTMGVQLAAGAGTPEQPFRLFALEVEAIAHFWLVSLFTYLFAARVLRNRVAGLATALTFTYGGYLTGYPPLQLAILETQTWLPLVLLGLTLWTQELRSRTTGLHSSDSPPAIRDSRSAILGLLLAGTALGLAFLAGHPQSAMLVVYVSLLYLGRRVWTDRKRPPAADPKPQTLDGMAQAAISQPRSAVGGRRSAVSLFLLSAACLLVLGPALAMVELAPGIEYMRLSTRAAASYEFLSNGFPLRDLIQMLLPGSVSLYSPLYVGILPFLLAGLGLAVRRDREPVFWGGLGLLALLLSFGANTAFYSLFYLAVPGFNLFQSQERAAFVVSFSLAMLAGFGLRVLLDEGTPHLAARRLSRYAAVLGVVLALLAAGFYWGWLWQGQTAESPFAAQMSRAAFAALVAGLSWAWLRKADAVPRPWWIAGVLALIVFDLFTVNRGLLFQPKPPENQVAPRPLVEPMQRDPDTFRAANEFRIFGNYGLVYGIEDTGGASPLELSRYTQLVKGVDEARLWELLNVKYVLTWRQQLGAPSEVIYQEPKGQEVTYLHRLAHVGPRAYLVYNSQVVSDEAALGKLADPAFNPWQTALLAEESSGPGAQPNVPLSGAPGVSPSPTIISEEPGRLVVDVDAAAAGLLVLSEIYYPGWRASVDGEAAPVLRAQLTLRAVPVPAGRHRVEMTFEPWTFKVGTLISVVAWLGLAATALWVAFKPRR